MYKFASSRVVPIKSRMAVAASVLTLLAAGPAVAQERDPFEFLNLMNRASAVMLTEEGVLSAEQATTIAETIEAIYAQSQSDPDFARTGSYLSLEPRMIAIGGTEISRLHTGRSSIDTGRTNIRMQERELILAAYEQLIETRQALLEFAAKNRDAIIPGYTLGVQAQPISLGHYITAYAGTFERHANLLEDVFENVNQSPLGSAAMGTSSYPINRTRLAELLGFSAPIDNSFDSVHLATLETGMRVVGATSAIALTTSQLMADLENQYRMIKPWFTFPYNLEGGSSIMPQKQNPDGVNGSRSDANEVIGYSLAYMMDSTKSASGDTDMNGNEPMSALGATAEMLEGVEEMFTVFTFHEDRALNEVLGDYATATELANALQRYGDIPFREAHHVAAVLVSYGRDNNLRPTDISFDQFSDVYAEVAAEEDIPEEVVLTEEQFLAALRPENMVANSVGLGGPQPSEVARMIEDRTATLAEDRAWLDERRAALSDAEAALEAAFTDLL